MVRSLCVRVSVDELRRQLLPAGRTAQTKGDTDVLAALLALRDEPVATWPSQSEVARALGITLVAVSHAVARARQRWSKTPALTRLRHDMVEMLEAQGDVMTQRELADAVLASRGSVQEQPLRSRYAAACVRAADEVERRRAAPRWIVRRVDAPAGVLLARDVIDDDGTQRLDGQGLADYAERLGRNADTLAGTDPLPSPTRVVDALQGVAVPAGMTTPAPNRLLALAAAVSRNAALSSRLELYPRGRASDRALKLALGALAGARTLTPEQIRQRVAGRYPEAARLPDRPALDTLLGQAGSELVWTPDADSGRGAYASRLREFVTVTSGTSYTRPTGRTVTGCRGGGRPAERSRRLRSKAPQNAGERSVPGAHGIATPPPRRGTRAGVGVPGRCTQHGRAADPPHEGRCRGGWRGLASGPARTTADPGAAPTGPTSCGWLGTGRCPVRKPSQPRHRARCCSRIRGCSPVTTR